MFGKTIALIAVGLCMAGCSQTRQPVAGAGDSVSRRVVVPDNASTPAPPSAAPTLTGLNSNVEDPNGTGVGASPGSAAGGASR